MQNTSERRREQRLRYHWPVWFAEDFAGLLSQGQMVDVCSGGAAFTCYADMGCPYPGQNITTRFSVPYYHQDNRFDINDFVRSGQVCRVEHISNGLHRVAIKFFDPLPFKPGELANSRLNEEEVLEPALA
ncbi:MAG: hypothetical protein ABSG97_01390 [Sedimentisphaerales bacterium]|jgi:hypothetical protein